MKKIPVTKVTQKDVVFYSMVADPRLIAKIRKKYTAGEKQDVQRPWIEKKVKEIAEYVVGNAFVDGKKSLGIIPNAPIINLKGSLKVKSEVIQSIENGKEKNITQYYISIPETDDEISKYENLIEIIDGQHRVIAFDNDFLDPTFKEDTPYEMIFSVFDNITDNQRKELFMVTNEKQDKVESNLLRYIKKSLGLLLSEDEETYNLLDAINNESSSPLFKRIMFGSDKVKKGYKENQVSKIFKNYGTKHFYDTVVKASSYDNPMQTFVSIVNNYLTAWEECANVSFQSPGNDTITKISGLRYLFYVFPPMCNHLLNKQQLLHKDKFKEIINTFPKALELENVKCVFCDDEGSNNAEKSNNRNLAFRGEGATIDLAKNDIQKVLSYQDNSKKGALI